MEKVKIIDFCNISNGFAFKSDKYISENGARVIRITNVQKGKIVDNDPKLYPFSELDKLEAYKIFEGDILMSLTGNVGRVGRFPKELLPAYINQRVCRVMPKNEKLDTNFLFHFLNSDVFENEAIKNSAGAAQLNLSTKWLGDFEIPLPPLATQQRIAAILDQADAIIQNNRAIVQKYDALTQSLFLDMFGDFRKNSNNFPKYLFDEIATKITDGDHLTPKREEKGYKLLSCRNIKNGYIDFSAGLDFVGESEFNRMFKRCNPEKGDILISCSGTIGRTTSIKIDEPFVLVRSAALVKPKRDLVDSLYLEYYLRTDYMQSVMKKSSNTSSQANLFTGPIKKLPIFLPPFKLQKQFAERVVVIEEQKQQAQLELAKSEELFQSLLQRAFNGELS